MPRMSKNKKEVIKMFLLKNECSFELNGIRITVPSNYYIDGSPDYLHENKLSFYPLDKSFEASYEVVEWEKGTKESFLEYARGGKSYNDFPPIEEFENNGLNGHHATYGDHKNQYYEARFLLDGTESHNIQLVFFIRTENQDIEEIKSSVEFKKLLNNVRKV